MWQPQTLDAYIEGDHPFYPRKACNALRTKRAYILKMKMFREEEFTYLGS